jgi:hypothetical protein
VNLNLFQADTRNNQESIDLERNRGQLSCDTSTVDTLPFVAHDAFKGCSTGFEGWCCGVCQVRKDL